MDRTRLEIVGTRLHIISLVLLFSVACSIIPSSLGSQSSSDIISSQGTIKYTALTWLHTDGKYIKNEAGENVFLRGAAFGDLTDLTWWNGGTERLKLRVNQYVNLTNGKANVIRCAITPLPNMWEGTTYPWEATLVDAANNVWNTVIHPEVYDSQVDELVDLAGRNNIYVVIEFHGGFGYNSNYGSAYEEALAIDPTPWINWHLHFANCYKNNPTVCGFEIYNEPWDGSFGGGNYTLGRERWHNMARQAVQAIHAVNPKALVFVASASPFNFIDDYWLEYPLGQNVVYTWDTYYKNWDYYWIPYCYDTGNFTLGLERMTDYLYRVSNIGKASMEYNLPVLGSEFGWFGNEWNNWQKQMADELNLLNEWKTNWYVWWWWDNPANLGLANSGYTTLSPQGVIWVKYLG